MSQKQRVAQIALPILVLVMIPVFRVYVEIFNGNWRIAWYLGLVTYWITWCGLFPLLLIGKSNIRKLIRPQRLSSKITILLLIPWIGAGLYRLIPGMQYEKP